MTESRRDFGERYEDEIALEHTRMRDLEVRRFDGCVAVKKNVEIDKAWALGEGFLAAHPGFDLPQCAEECRGREIGLCFEDGVEEPGLVEIIDRFGFVDAGNREHLDRSVLQVASRFPQILCAVANVGA